MNPKPLIGPRGKIPILLRDDDTNYFTNERMLESVYSEAWSQGFKVSFSVVPLQGGIDDIAVPPGSRESNRYYSIAENESLTKYIGKKIDNGIVEVVQHGLSHEPINGIRGEFGGNSGKNGDIEKGRNIIKQAFKAEPKFFVPPGEDISNENLRAVLQQGLIPVYRDTIIDRILRSRAIPNYVKNTAMRMIMSNYVNETDENFGVQFIKPVLISTKSKGITWSLPNIRTSHITSTNSLFNLTNRIITICRQNRGPVCLINHYHLYYYDWSSTITKSDLITTWNKIVNSFDKLEISWKTTFLELYNRLNELRGVYIIKTGSKITIKTDAFINDFSFQTGKALETSSVVTFDKEMNIATLAELSPETDFVFYERD
jgi:hypothetical protein